MAVQVARRSVWQLAPLAGDFKRLENTNVLNASPGYRYTTKIKLARELISLTSHTCASHRRTFTDTVHINIHSIVRAMTQPLLIACLPTRVAVVHARQVEVVVHIRSNEVHRLC